MKVIVVGAGGTTRELLRRLSTAWNVTVIDPNQGRLEDAVAIRVSQPGRYVIVPRGHWHTARSFAPTSMLFVTAGEGTRNEVDPPESSAPPSAAPRPPA